MPILSADIKLLESAVMADTSDGGGQMTGNVIADGTSNNLFPDTSAMDRAFGRYQTRKVFGVAQTADTDTLMGAHALITDAPDDPMVHCTLMQTTGWADTRDVAQDLVERYLVKGPKASVRIYDTHYAGSAQLRLITFVNSQFPAGGDALVLHNPDNSEQYVRIVNITTAVQQLALYEGATVLVQATVATCELAKPLDIDVLGPPGVRIFGQHGVGAESSYAMLYTTSVAAGAKFYGIKALQSPVTTGAYSVTVAGGVSTPLIPAATIETPVIDQYPLLTHASVDDSGYTTLACTMVNMATGAGVVLYAPSAIAPGGLSLVIDDVGTFTDSGGVLLRDGVDYGTVDYALGTVNFSPSSPNLSTHSVRLNYRPGAVIAAPGYSASLTITSGNQGLSYVQAFEPPPAPATLSLSFMAQGRWYELTSDYAGKLSGADSSYGVGTINYGTGSMAVTLGAIPDVGSALVANWGSAHAFEPVLQSILPTKASTTITLTLLTSSYTGATISWSRGASNYSASTSATGAISGDATGQWVGAGKFKITPNVFPDGAITVVYDPLTVAAQETAFSPTLNPREYSLDNMVVEVQTGSIYGYVDYVFDASTADFTYALTYRLYFYDRAGVLYCYSPRVNAGAAFAIGTANVITGLIAFDASFTAMASTRVNQTPVSGDWDQSLYVASTSPAVSRTFVFDGLYEVHYNDTGVVAAQTTANVTPSAWTLEIDPRGGDTVQDSVVFTLGGELYSTFGGTLRKGWNVQTGAATVTNAGSVATSGLITITSLPSSGSNTVAWYNFAQNHTTSNIRGGTFRTANAPLKAGVMQLGSGALIGTTSEGGTISGDFGGTVDFVRGIVKWTRTAAIAPATLSYNAVYLQYLPLQEGLLGLDTSRLPLDGKVPIYRSGDLVVVHNTQSTTITNPLTKDNAYSLGRTRIAAVRVVDSVGTVVPDTLYVTDLDAGTFTVPLAANITAYTQPLIVQHRIEDMLLCSQVDISGALRFTRSLTHDFPATTSFASSVLPIGDVFARSHTVFDQATWTGVWSDTVIGAGVTAQYNTTLAPIAVTNDGAIKERWALIFTNTTTFNIVGETVGVIGQGGTATNCAPLNPATGQPYFTVLATGWGSGWASGNVLRFNTDACGAPFWAVRTILQGPASLESDQFTLAFRGDVDRP